jgi:hypothetical protein
VSQRCTIGSLPDNVLLDIFDFYQVITNTYEHQWCHPYSWVKLVHVCQRWRCIVFESPIRLDLQLYCRRKTPVRKLLSLFPASLPIIIDFKFYFLDPWYRDPAEGWDILKHCHRIRQIHIANTKDYQWEEVVTEMQRPFPALRSLLLETSETVTLPDSFLNGSAPCLQDLSLRQISFPSLPRFLLTTSDLTSLHLLVIPNSGYISPLTMATSLSALPKLESLFIDFEYPTRLPERPPPPPTRFVLPALAELQFQGMSEYFEVLVAQFDAPLLDRFNITFGFSRQPELVFDIPQTFRFFSHLKWPERTRLTLMFDPPYDTSIIFPPSNTYRLAHKHHRSWKFIGRWLDWQVSSVTHICSQILPFHSNVESLSIQCPNFSPHEDIISIWFPQDEMNSTLWSELFRSFTSVLRMEIPAPLEPFIVAALQGLQGEGVPEVLPSLHSLAILGDGRMSDEFAPRYQGIQPFVAARQRSGHPVAIYRW